MIAFTRPQGEPDKQAFHHYLSDFRAVEDETALLAMFASCTDVLPTKYADLLFLPPAATYRDAVALLLSSWNGPFSSACDWPGDGSDFPLDE